MLSPLRKRAGRRLREPFGKAGLTVAVVALVFAMIGGAYAAGKLTSKQKKEVEKIAMKFQGTGPAGPQGPAGANGKDGVNGSNGLDGTDGTDGTGATTVSFSGAAHGCTEGGVEVKSAGSPTFLCNGENGQPGESPFTESFTGAEEETRFGIGQKPCKAQGGVEFEVEGQVTTACNGAEGSPWTAGGTLPPGKVETGTWAFSRPVQTIEAKEGGVEKTIVIGGSEKIYVPISFPIPLASALNSTQVHYSSEATFATFCGGTVSEPLVINSGELCVYEQVAGQSPVTGTTFEAIYKGTSKFSTISTPKGASIAGAVLRFAAPTANALGAGTFAIKG